MTLLEAIASKCSSTIFGYLHLWAYLDKRLTHALAGASTHRLSTNHDFYCKLVGQEIKHGDRVIWDQVYLSEWMPRVPGGFSYLTMINKLSEEKYFTLPTEDACGLLTRSLRFDYRLEPYGAVRLPIRRDRWVVLSGVTSSEYTIDQGVVFAVTHSVYRQFLSRQLRNKAVEATVEAFVDLGEDQSLPNLKASNAEANAVLEQVLRRPMCILRIDSPLQVEFRTHNTHPAITAWSLRRSRFLGDTFHVRGPY